MKMKMKSSVWVILFILGVLLCECEGCWKQESEALLALNAQFASPLPDWEDNTDCCQWVRVQCNISTGRVVALDLSAAWGNRDQNLYLNYSHFQAFQHLNSLNLANNNIAACAANQGLMLSNLQVLDLSSTSLDNAAAVQSCVNGFSTSPSLSTYHRFNATPSPGSQSMFINLEVLDMSFNNFNETDITSALTGLSSLRSLKLESTQLTSGSIHNISKLRSLEILYLAENGLNESILC
ncbi:hypothetical protein RJT34_17514 [Clitoria ternatea]|uniref:Leucine-rich repeat-containing N-terminal plant-type domain-containing protein n=1 Tax=Clitoria ternatea TaxID=43366 RepID=A0AAN9J929_CLITE